jgi:hypothetical protein
MRVEGIIQLVGDDLAGEREAWHELLARRPEFRRPGPRQTINPFTREPMMISPRLDVAEVVVDGVPVGQVDWSADEDEAQILVSIERSAIRLA